MDVSTAKTLVSALLVSAILLFTFYSLDTALAAVSADLKAARARRREWSARSESTRPGT